MWSACNDAGRCWRVIGAGQELINQGINGQGCNLGKVAKSTLSGMVGGLLGGSGASYGNKYISGHVSRFFRHAVTDGVKKAGKYLWKMTATYSKQFVGKTIWGIAKSTAGSHSTDAIVDRFTSAIDSRRQRY